MVQVRYWQPADLPDLERMMVQLALGIAPPEDRAAVGDETLARAAVRGLHTLLRSPGGTAAVAVEGGRPVGFLLACLQQDDRTGEWLGYLADVFVEPEFRGKGVGRTLEQLASSHLRQLGLQKAQVWTHAHNPLGQAAARSYGLQIRGIVLSKELHTGAR